MTLTAKVRLHSSAAPLLEALEAADAGDVAEHVEPAERRDRGVDRRLHRGHVGHVARLTLGRTAGRLDARQRLVQAVALDVDGEDLGALLREERRGGPTDAGARARHEHDLAAEALRSHHRHTATTSSTGASVARSFSVWSMTAATYSSGVPVTASRGITTW